MRTERINTLAQGILNDNRDFMTGTVAEYIISNAEQTSSWAPFLESEASEEEIEELKEYLEDNFDFPAKTYDVYYHNDDNSNNNGFEMTKDEAIDYIKTWNGTDHSYFKDYKGGVVQAVCNEVDEDAIYEEVIK